MNLFFNTEIISENQSFFELAADFCLTPVRYLFEGRSITIGRYGTDWTGLIDSHQVLENKNYFPDKTWFGIALAVATIAFGLFFGTIFKALATCSSATRENREIASLYIDLKKSHGELEVRAHAIREEFEELESPLNHPHFVNMVNEFMLLAEKETDLFFRSLEKEGKNNPDVMAEILRSQYGVEGTYGLFSDSFSDEFGNFKQIDDDKSFINFTDGGYCYKFFNSSLTEIYHLIRNHAAEEGEGAVQHFFNEESIHSEWRNIYNEFCAKLDPLRKHLTDQRFSNWATEDDDPSKKVETDTKPTLLHSHYLMNGSLYNLEYPQALRSEHIQQFIRNDW